MRAFLVSSVLCLGVAFAHDNLPINPELGVPGFPDCVQTWANPSNPELSLVCHQKPKDTADQISVGCVGDSITAGVHSSGGNHTYPGQLQIMLGDKYKVTNLGACGSTMMKGANSPYWQRPQYKTLTANTWDIIIIMLGTNDAKDQADGGPANWPHDCTGPDALDCAFAVDYKSMIDVVRTLGPDGKSPDIYIAIPPPLHQSGVYGMNGTVINQVFPVLVPAINKANSMPHSPIDVFGGMGGANWPTFPPSCTISNGNVDDCALWCDQQSCDQCHPNNDGYTVMAKVMKAGIGL